MKKFKVGLSFLLFIIFSLIFNKIALVFNYLLALSLHELAHLFVAVKSGYTLKIARLDMFGLSIELNEQIDHKDSFKINIAGPFFNLLLALICMALYWLIPTCYIYLNTFCFSNIIIAIFNLLPVYPLDGGKIFRGMVKSDKAYVILDRVIRYSLAGLFICAFVFSCFGSPNLILLIFAIFFLFTGREKTPTMSIFKYRQNKHFDKVVILKVEETETLFSLIKQIKPHNYTIFYVPKLNKYFDEDNVIELSLQHSLTSKLIEI